MKKILFSILAIGSLLLSSCSMDTAPHGVLTDKDGMNTFVDCEAARIGTIYSSLRGFGTGAYIYLTELQMDMFLGTQTNGNRNGQIATGNIMASDGDITSIWAACYSSIGRINYFITNAKALIASGVLSDDEVVKVNAYIGEAHFARAMYYTYLFDHFCQTYSEGKANQKALGLPLVTEFEPSEDRNTYKGRSTMAETFQLIDNDLQTAFDALVEYETYSSAAIAQNSAYISSYTVEALWARTYLMRGEGFYELAIEKADDVILEGTWTLTPYARYAALWNSDQGTEVIFRPYIADAGYSEAGGVASTGGAWLNSNYQEADYLPTYACYTTYDQSDPNVNDVRLSCFFKEWNLAYHGTTYKAQVFYKYHGNPALNSASDALKNMPKPFRLSELYLIKAEAAWALGDEITANDALDAIRNQRILGYQAQTYSGDLLRDEIRLERTRELMGEGFRMSDLRRWGLGFSRVSNFPGYNLGAILRELDKNVVYTPGDHRYVWPIPQDEIETNPQIAGQQNPGY
jgi:hypothetical protein